MDTASKYDILFEPVRIGPVTAPNRFYQVPHCSGMGSGMPRTLAAMRAIKAEGGWGVVNTEYCSIHPTCDDSPYPHATLWDDDDLSNLASVAERVHEHGSLAGIQLWYGGGTSNLLNRKAPLGMDSLPVGRDPVQTKRMTRRDIRDLRKWQVDAARRAMRAGFDIVYVYATHDYLLHQFLSPDYNTRSDEYGGCLENRVRLVREMLEDTKSAVGHKCAVAVRFSADSGATPDGCAADDEHRDMIAMLADLPDLWNINIRDYNKEMGSSRFFQEAALESHVSYVKGITDKPVVGVGRFTSPDTMVRMIKRGVLDLIGAARPSIADPFMPEKIRAGRIDEIRECIGCNVCYAHDVRGVPIRCTQNPTMGEEWRRGWHPEHVPPRDTDEPVLIVGAGPAGLEASLVLGKRGYPVILADSESDPGGRLNLECRLPGLSEYARVRDYRVGRILSMANVEIYMNNLLTPEDVLESGYPRVIVATGSRWRTNGLGRHFTRPVIGYSGSNVLSPDDLMRNAEVSGRVVLFDDDHYYMGTVLADLLAQKGCHVTYVTTESKAGAWSVLSQEQEIAQRRLLEVGVEIITNHAVTAVNTASAELCCRYTGRSRSVPIDVFVPVTSREPADTLYLSLHNDAAALEKSGIRKLIRIGDCNNPGIIAAAVFAGHLAGREIDSPDAERPGFRRDRVVIGSDAIW
jgi:dimethylamine/trimethylamine dehydrogenase